MSPYKKALLHNQIDTINMVCTRIVYNNRYLFKCRYVYTFSFAYEGNKKRSYFFLMTLTSVWVVFRLWRRRRRYGDYAELFGDSVTQTATFDYTHVNHNTHYS